MKLVPLIAAFAAATSVITSCLNNNDYEISYSSESSITGFSIGTLYIDKVGTDQNGDDSAYIDTITFSNYYFTIDQSTRTIENKDSFPVGTYTDKVTTSITYDSGSGLLFYRPNGSSSDTLWTSTDSIDFTEPLEFRVYLYNGLIGSPYTIKLNVHQVEPDTITWKDFSLTFNSGNLTYQKALYANGCIYVFGKDESGNAAIEYTEISDENPDRWTSIEMSETTLKPYSAISWNGEIYFLNESGELQMLDTYDNSITSVEGVTETFAQLIGGDDTKEILYAITDDNIVGNLSADGIWTSDDSQPENLADIVSQRISSYSEALSYNQNITRMTILCNNPGSNTPDSAAVVYQRMSSEDEWLEVIQNQPMPNMENIVMVHYDDQLYAFGGPSTYSGSIAQDAFYAFYNSADYGLAWLETTECMYFPEDFASRYTGNEGNFSAASSPEIGTSKGNFIWIIWENGNISRGRINRLGFDSKW